MNLKGPPHDRGEDKTHWVPIERNPEEGSRRILLKALRDAFEAGFARGCETQASHDIGMGHKAMTMREGWDYYKVQVLRNRP